MARNSPPYVVRVRSTEVEAPLRRPNRCTVVMRRRGPALREAEAWGRTGVFAAVASRKPVR